jgi:hypothetical protein
MRSTRGRDRDLGVWSGPTRPDRTERTNRETKFYFGLSVLYVELYYGIVLRTCTYNKVRSCLLFIPTLFSFIYIYVLCSIVYCVCAIAIIVAVLLFSRSRAIDTFFED